ncbi:hypothetical protein ERO13_A01G120000v2 [Gossypium hirsutum]|uniref:Cold-regulated protein 27 n=1 Tax=Gossypium hirsutum TaxID=3635 RepID=A0A1U8KIN1_GOSHI|nr:cold-regulated protein 27-like [Gossypium hirsutum]KAG4214409.1 hypothetical protein ERO13_A01G120000v2 [Gossypium hirsutum]
MEGFIRTESWTSSEANGLESPRFALHQQVPCSASLMTESTSTEWTDEKRSLYLKSMEASFVNQLYDSWNFLGWSSKLSRQTHGTSSDQYKVLRGDRWKKINFEGPGFRLNKRDRSSCFMASPWVQHLRSGSKSRVLASCSHLQDNASSKEVSDQNFVDEEQGEKSSRECSSKKLKTVAVETPCNDEVIL